VGVRAGEPIASPLRTVMESRFAHDFGAVRIHDDEAAHAAAGDFAAAAFTTGSDIFLGAGQRSTDIALGHPLLAHELAHVVQNERAIDGPSSLLQSLSATGDAAETEAEAAAQAVLSGGSPQVISSPSAVVARSTGVEIPAWLETIRRQAIGDTGGTPTPTGPTLVEPHIDGGVNKAGGYTVDASFGPGVKSNMGSIDTNYVQGQFGAWDEGDSTRHGFRANAGVGKASLNENYIGELMGDPTLVVGADVGFGTVNAEANINPDTGFALGAQANAIEASLSGGRKDPNSNIDEWARFGMSLGGGAALRGHWGDEDKDGKRSYGFGADFGPFSFDVKSEDPVRTGMRLGGGSGVADLLPDNLTDATGDMVSNYIDQASNVVQQIPSIPTGVIPGLDAVMGMGLPDISLPSMDDILSIW